MESPREAYDALIKAGYKPSKIRVCDACGEIAEEGGVTWDDRFICVNCEPELPI